MEKVDCSDMLNDMLGTSIDWTVFHDEFLRAILPRDYKALDGKTLKRYHGALTKKRELILRNVWCERVDCQHKFFGRECRQDMCGRYNFTILNKTPVPPFCKVVYKG